jgi:hypothetical protein
VGVAVGLELGSALGSPHSTETGVQGISML